MSETDATADVLSAASRDPSTRSTVLICNPSVSLREVLRRGASRINKLTAQLSVARAEAEQARGKAIEEQAPDDMEALQIDEILLDWCWNRRGQKCVTSWDAGELKMELEKKGYIIVNRIALSTATTPKGEG